MVTWRRFRIFWLRMSRSSSRLIAVILTVLVSIMIYLQFISDGKPVLKVADRLSQKQPLFRYGPVKKKDEAMPKQTISACPILALKAFTNVATSSNNDSVPVTCTRVPPVPGSCQAAKELFETLPVSSCSHQEHHEFCKLKRSSTGWSVACEAQAIRVCRGSLSLGLPRKSTGELVWEEHKHAQHLASRLSALVQGQHVSRNIHYGFAFIWCSTADDNDPEENVNENEGYYNYPPASDIFVEQLLILPPVVRTQARTHPGRRAASGMHDLNVNMVLVDSTSRQHVFRSLPKTVQALANITHSSAAQVFDFELFQAIKSRTFETLQVIFSGHLNISEPPFNMFDVLPKPLNLAPIFKSYQDQGFKTLWLEDLCYLWEWGISKDLRFLNLSSSAEDTWKKMWGVLKTNGVDFVDVTLSMCRVLEANGVRDHFHGPEAVCFNGRHQHEYLLDYLKLYQVEMDRLGQPYFAMTSTNVGHEGTGVRIQTLDKHLAEYVAFTPSLDHTISIIFSDHGNSYGKFFEKSSNEAQVELYHPFMFVIIPPSAASLIGARGMKVLGLNAKRLVTALDLHYTLAFLGNVSSNGFLPAKSQEFAVSERGLFGVVPPDRSCNAVPRIRPNICLCQNSDLPLEPSSYAGLLGFMAVGLINEEIQRQYKKSLNSQHSGTGRTAAFGRCQPMYLYQVTDIKESSGPGGNRVFQLTLRVQQSQVFVVSIAATYKRHNGPTVDAVLDTVTRITRYADYASCTDPSVDVSLCICNLSTIAAHHNLQNPVQQLGNKKADLVTNTFQKAKLNILPFVDSSSTPLQTNPCLFISYVKHSHGAAIFSINDCRDAYAIQTEIRASRQFIYFEQKEEVTLQPGGVAFVGLVVSEYSHIWDCSLAADYRTVT